MKYLIDTNVLIRSKNDMPMDLWPTFWERFTGMARRGEIYSIAPVKDEIERGKDELTRWIKEDAPAGFFLPLDADAMTAYADVQNWAASRNHYTEAALHDFADVADAYLVAVASAKQMRLVTYETPDEHSRRRVKIPDACKALGVTWCDLNAVLRDIGITI